jgi:SAM-dependent methyltransferase
MCALRRSRRGAKRPSRRPGRVYRLRPGLRAGIARGRRRVWRALLSGGRLRRLRRRPRGNRSHGSTPAAAAGRLGFGTPSAGYRMRRRLFSRGGSATRLERGRTRALSLRGRACPRRRFDVHPASILDPPELDPVDVVTMWDTIEHVSDPVRAVRNARALLRPGGVLVISTGDRRSAIARVCGRRWRLLADATHKFFFDEATLRQLMAHQRMRTVTVSRPGKWVSASMVLHQAGLPGAAPLRRWLSRHGWNPAVYVNLRDVMTLVAEHAL